jgi:hypothetical protein
VCNCAAVIEAPAHVGAQACKHPGHAALDSLIWLHQLQLRQPPARCSC